MKDPQLGGGKAHAQGVVHELAHARDLPLQRLVEALDRHGAGTQDRVAELAHQAEGGIATRARLGVELLDGRRVLLALDLDIRIVGDRSSALLDGLAQCLLFGHRPMSLCVPRRAIVAAVLRQDAAQTMDTATRVGRGAGRA